MSSVVGTSSFAGFRIASGQPARAQQRAGCVSRCPQVPRLSSSRSACFTGQAKGLIRPPSLATCKSKGGAARPSRRCGLDVRAAAVAPGAKVLVVGATGGVGQLLTAKLLERGYTVRALCRNVEKATSYLGTAEGLELVVGDCRDASSLKGIAKGVDAVVCCTGTTAFPSARWKDGNGPENTDYVGNMNLIAAVQADAPSLKRFVYISSVGVERTNKMPFIILNAFGVLKYKGMTERYIAEESGFPFTFLRPGRLTDGPYTSYDLNTLLKATSGTKRAVQVEEGDELLPEATSRLVVAEACVQALGMECTEGRAYVLASTEGEGPGQDAESWTALFAGANK